MAAVGEAPILRMKNIALFLLGVAVIAAVPAKVWTQEAGYPVTLIPPGKGPYSFPANYQTPWDKIQIMATIAVNTPGASQDGCWTANRDHSQLNFIDFGLFQRRQVEN